MKCSVHTDTDVTYNCWRCGAPNCCEKCCVEATREMFEITKEFFV